MWVRFGDREGQELTTLVRTTDPEMLTRVCEYVAMLNYVGNQCFVSLHVAGVLNATSTQDGEKFR
jgi:hypothetical protein